MKVKTWNIEQMTGYKPQTTFYEDFSIADMFGINAIKDTYKRGLEACESLGYIYLYDSISFEDCVTWCLNS